MHIKRTSSAAARPLLSMLILIMIAVSWQTGATKANADKAASLQVTIGSVSAVNGQDIRIPVSIGEPDAGIGSYGIQIDYDKSAVEVLGVTPSYGSDDEAACGALSEGCFKAFHDNENGWLRAVWADASGGDRPIAAARELFVIKARVKSGASAGSKALSVDTTDPSNLTFTDANLHALHVIVAPGSLSVSQPPPVARDDSGTVTIVVNGQVQENSATKETKLVNNRTVTTVNVDAEKVMQQMKNTQMKTLLLPVSDASDTVVGELNGQLVKVMEGQEATVAIQTSRASYTLPASQINIDGISSAMGSEVPLQDIKISVVIEEPSAARKAQIDTAAENAGVVLAVPPIEFSVTAAYGGKTIQVDKFNAYVERAVALPEDVDPAKITTGVVVGDNGAFTHVPTKIVKKDDRYYATINSLTNSTYTVVWHSRTFADSRTHWARKEIENLASRMVLQGVSEDAFEPDRQITRAEFTAMLLRALGLRPAGGVQPAGFADIEAGAWFAPYVSAAVSNGLVGGYAGGTFRPDAPISRAEAIVMLTRASKLAKLVPASDTEREPLLGAFSDRGSVAPWARDAIASAVKQGIVQGSGGKLSPKQAITRAQTAAMVQRLLVKAALING